jgi:hypothetical protein
MIRRPAVDEARSALVWNEHVHALRDAYAMNP